MRKLFAAAAVLASTFVMTSLAFAPAAQATSPRPALVETTLSGKVSCNVDGKREVVWTLTLGTFADEYKITKVEPAAVGAIKPTDKVVKGTVLTGTAVLGDKVETAELKVTAVGNRVSITKSAKVMNFPTCAPKPTVAFTSTCAGVEVVLGNKDGTAPVTFVVNGRPGVTVLGGKSATETVKADEVNVSVNVELKDWPKTFKVATPPVCPTVSTTPPTVPATTPVAVPAGNSLPVTGFPVPLAIALGTLMLAAGGAAVWLARRRKIMYQA